jgi:FkbM family methyltransferase
MTDQISPFGTYAPTPLQKAVLAVVRATIFRRGFSRETVRRILEWLRPGPIDTEVGGSSFRLWGANSPTELSLLLNPGFDEREMAFLAENLGPGMVFVDAGSNVGGYSLLLRAQRPGTKIVAIEPNPVTLERLRFNCASSGADDIAIVDCAIGDRDGEIQFFHDAQNLGASRVDQAGDVKVAMRRLFEVLTDLDVTAVDALKIDIEGHEDNGLLPFFATAPQSMWPKRVVIEDSHAEAWRENCIGTMLKLGYRIVGRTKRNALLIRDSTQGP